jgi:hypothetical protein
MEGIKEVERKGRRTRPRGGRRGGTPTKDGRKRCKENSSRPIGHPHRPYRSSIVAMRSEQYGQGLLRISQAWETFLDHEM